MARRFVWPREISLSKFRLASAEILTPKSCAQEKSMLHTRIWRARVEEWIHEQLSARAGAGGAAFNLTVGDGVIVIRKQTVDSKQ